MNAGRVEQIGTQTDIYLQPQTRFVAEFIGANNGLEGTHREPSTGPARTAGRPSGSAS